MRRSVRDALLSAGALGGLLLVLVAIDDRVREQVTQRFVAHPTVTLSTLGTQARELLAIAVDAARAQSIAHAPLMIFVLAASVLFALMLRS